MYKSKFQRQKIAILKVDIMKAHELGKWSNDPSKGCNREEAFKKVKDYLDSCDHSLDVFPSYEVEKSEIEKIYLSYSEHAGFLAMYYEELTIEHYHDEELCDVDVVNDSYYRLVDWIVIKGEIKK